VTKLLSTLNAHLLETVLGGNQAVIPGDGRPPADRDGELGGKRSDALGSLGGERSTAAGSLGGEYGAPFPR